MAGESANTRKKLMEDAGFVPSDFSETPTGAAADRMDIKRTGNKPYNPREMSQKEHDAQQAADNAKASDAYQKWVAGGKK